MVKFLIVLLISFFLRITSLSVSVLTLVNEDILRVLSFNVFHIRFVPSYSNI